MNKYPITNLLIRDSLRFGYALTKQFSITLPGIILFVTVLQMIVMKSTEHSVFLSIVAMVLIYPAFSLGLTSLWLSVSGGELPSFKLVTGRTDRYLPFIQITLLYQIIVVLGLIFFIIPGVYFALKYIWASYLVLDKNLSPMDALKKSGEISKGQMWQILKFLLVITVINICGALFFGVGLLFTIPVTMSALAFNYRCVLLPTVPAQKE